MIRKALDKLYKFYLFIREVKNESLKIQYPNYQMVMSYTVIIVIVSILVAIMISIIDVIIYNLLKLLFLGIQ